MVRITPPSAHPPAPDVPGANPDQDRLEEIVKQYIFETLEALEWAAGLEAVKSNAGVRDAVKVLRDYMKEVIKRNYSTLPLNFNGGKKWSLWGKYNETIQNPYYTGQIGMILEASFIWMTASYLNDLVIIG